MSSEKINPKVLMSGAEYFDDAFAINAYMDDQIPVDLSKAIVEHAEIKTAFEQAGIEVVKVAPPKDCQDGIYTANWALVVGNRAIMSNLPNKRQDEEPYARAVLAQLGKEIIELPKEFRFSGQGDCLPCGKYLFVGSQYRTSHEVWPLLARDSGMHVIGLQTVAQLDDHGAPVTNPVTGWPDSFFYDLDLALAVITPSLIAWCPDAFTPKSQQVIEAIADIEKIEVSLHEAQQGFACNLVSTGETVIMSNKAPLLQAELRARGFATIAPDVTELLKGGGFIRCSSLTL